MNSLLSEEIKKYNSSNLDKNIEKEISEKIIIKNIEKNIEYNNFINKEYSINMNIFNPMKNSPPNYWNNRLISRINKLNNFN